MFHWSEGWWFERMPDGSVHVVKRSNAREDAPVWAEATIPAAQWASIVASVSQWTETGPSYQMALAFHGEGKG